MPCVEISQGAGVGALFGLGVERGRLLDRAFEVADLLLEAGILLLQERHHLIGALYEGFGVDPLGRIAAEFLLGRPTMLTGLGVEVARLWLAIIVLDERGFGAGVGRDLLVKLHWWSPS